MLIKYMMQSASDDIYYDLTCLLFCVCRDDRPHGQSGPFEVSGA